MTGRMADRQSQCELCRTDVHREAMKGMRGVQRCREAHWGKTRERER